MSLDVRAVAVVVFWGGLLLPLYSYVLFPVLIIVWGRSIESLRRSRVASFDERFAPDVAVVVAAHNEERDIGRLLDGFSRLRYAGRLRLYVGSDGSTDRTVDRLAQCPDPRLRVFDFSENRGKAAVLNDLLDAVQESVVVFTDANTQLAPEAVTMLVRHFSDEQVGVVCGELSLVTRSGGDNADGVYWRIERVLKRAEASLGALLGANGAIYAIRRRCYSRLMPRTIVDDFCIGMSIATRGYRIIYEPSAKAYEETPLRMHDEFARRVRIGIGNYQTFFRHPEYLLRAGVVRGFAYFSHKVLRWFTPHLLLAAFLANLALWSERYFGLVFLSLWGSGVLLGLLYGLSRYINIPRMLRFPVMFVGINVALFTGFLRFLSGGYSGGWLRTRRT
jgi:cellulose synthase/poly-beta-1,6-N-acetylglucosamine synthase-like glycosyltransferase